MSNHPRLAVIHTSATLAPVFSDLLRSTLPDNVSSFHLSDDSLIADVIRDGGVTTATEDRVADYVRSAEAMGADLILVTCSSIGRAVENAAETVSAQVLRVDQPMVDQAIASGSRLGVVATLSTTLEPTVGLVTRRAEAAGKEVSVAPQVCEGAFEALMSGDPERHDRLVRTAIEELAADVDVIILAQASMGRIAAGLPEDFPVPVLTSPPIAAAEVSTRLSELAG